jgi:hypothetical protein
MEHSFEVTSGGMIHMWNFMMIDSGIQVILRLLLQQVEKLLHWYYLGKEFMKYALEFASSGMIYIPIFLKTGFGIEKLLRGIHIQTQTHIQQDDL